MDTFADLAEVIPDLIKAIRELPALMVRLTSGRGSSFGEAWKYAARAFSSPEEAKQPPAKKDQPGPAGVEIPQSVIDALSKMPATGLALEQAAFAQLEGAQTLRDAARRFADLVDKFAARQPQEGQVVDAPGSPGESGLVKYGGQRGGIVPQLRQAVGNFGQAKQLGSGRPILSGVTFTTNAAAGAGGGAGAGAAAGGGAAAASGGGSALAGLAGVVGPLAGAGVAAIAFGAAVYGGARATEQWGREILSTQAALKQFSGTIALAMGNLEVADIRRQIASAGRTDQGTAYLAESQASLEGVLQPFKDVGTNLKALTVGTLENVFGAVMSPFATIAEAMNDTLKGIASELRRGKDKDSMVPMRTLLLDAAREEMRRAGFDIDAGERGRVKEHNNAVDATAFDYFDNTGSFGM